jgi:hypothetical protein
MILPSFFFLICGRNFILNYYLTLSTKIFVKVYELFHHVLTLLTFFCIGLLSESISSGLIFIFLVYQPQKINIYFVPFSYLAHIETDPLKSDYFFTHWPQILLFRTLTSVPCSEFPIPRYLFDPNRFLILLLLLLVFFIYPRGPDFSHSKLLGAFIFFYFKIPSKSKIKPIKLQK